MRLKSRRRAADPDRMSPLSLVPAQVPAAAVRRLSDGVEESAPVQQVVVPVVPAARVVPRQLDPVALRLMALQLENEDLRAELDQLRSA